jgi:hypothetical protein
MIRFKIKIYYTILKVTFHTLSILQSILFQVEWFHLWIVF